MDDDESQRSRYDHDSEEQKPRTYEIWFPVFRVPKQSTGTHAEEFRQRHSPRKSPSHLPVSETTSEKQEEGDESLDHQDDSHAKRQHGPTDSADIKS